MVCVARDDRVLCSAIPQTTTTSAACMRVSDIRMCVRGGGQREARQREPLGRGNTARGTHDNAHDHAPSVSVCAVVCCACPQCMCVRLCMLCCVCFCCCVSVVC